MCLALLALDSVPGRPLVLAANRDERHDRPAAPMDWWPDMPDILGGRDVRAGGTWLAVRRDGRFATVLNDARVPPRARSASRGELVPHALGEAEVARVPRQVYRRRERYAGFHLVVGTPASGWYCGSQAEPPGRLSADIHAVGNAGLNPGGPRLERATEQFRKALDSERSADLLLDLLSDRTHPGRGPGDDRPIFIENPEFGTRCSTVLLIDADGHACMQERRFDADGEMTGETRRQWIVEAGGERP